MPAKKNKAILIITAAMAILSPLILWANPTNPPLARTGAPGESTCASCHGGGNQAGHISLVFSGGTTYTPGVQQQVTVTITDPDAVVWGYELTEVQATATSTGAGTMTAGDANSAIRKGTGANVNKYYAAHIRDTVSSFVINWTPPATNVGNVVFYVSSVGGDASGNQSIYNASATLTPASAGLPTISSAPTSLSFAYTQNGTTPAAQSLAIASSGAAVSYTVAASQTWLAATPASGTTPGSISVSINPAGLAAGSYSGNVTVTSAGASNSPLTIPVSLTVAAAPTLTLAPTTLSFTAQAGGAAPAAQSVSTSSSGAALSFTTTSSTTSGGSWLTASPASGTTPGSISVSVNPAGLAAGTYAGTVSVAAAAAGNSPRTVAVTFTVTAAPVNLTLSPTTLSFTAQAGGAAPAAQSVATSSSGTAISYTTTSSTTSGGSWLTATPASGTTPVSISVTVNPTGLAAGTYSGTVSVASAGAANSPRTVAVTFTVTAAALPNLTLSPTTLSFTAQAGGAAPAAQSVSTNSSGAALSFTTTSSTVSGGSWLTATPASGTTPGSISVSVNPTGLAAGTYTGTVSVASAGAANSPRTVAVTFTVTAAGLPSLTLSPTTLSFTAQAGGAAPAAQSVSTSSSGAALSFTTTSTTTSGGSWLTASPASGTTPGSISVAVNPTGLAAGTYSGTVSVASAGAANSPRTVAVTFTITATALTKEWTWIGGSKTSGQPGVYGTLGTPAAGNIPGSRDGASSWNDGSGNLWLFGGVGVDANGTSGWLNDLWEFNATTHQWTWISGSSTISCVAGKCSSPAVYGTLGNAAAGNTPGSRSYASSWTDATGNLWIFGGIGVDSAGNSGYRNELWRFNSSTGQWAWMGGSNQANCGAVSNCGPAGVYGTLGMPAAANVPGGRQKAVSWTDSSGNLWLFGGDGCDANGACASNLNDLWEFSPSANDWTWIGGSNQVPNATGVPGVYGTLGTPAAGNLPGARSDALSWTDPSGHLWLFGGIGPDSSGTKGYLNDFWEFDPGIKEWTWMGGSNTLTCVQTNNQPCGQAGVYGTLGTPASANIPSGRYGASGWVDGSGNLWLLGGQVLNANPNQANGATSFNDLWQFNQSLNQWAWMGGSSTNSCGAVAVCGISGIYGTLGLPALSNQPGSRLHAASWTDSNGLLWLFGGAGFASSGASAELNDLWEYLPPATPTVSVTPTPTSITTVQALSVAVKVNAVGSNPTPTGTVKLTSGTYSSAAATLSGGNATISVPGGSLRAGTDTLAVAYTPDTPSSSIYNVAGGKATVTVTKITPTVTVTPSASSISTAQVLTVTVVVNGGAGNPTPTGSVIIAGGNYTSAATALTAGSASVVIPAGSLTAGNDTLQATYTPDTSGALIYTSASNTTSVQVTSPTFTVTGTAVSVARGAVTGNTSTVTVTPAGGFTGSVTLTAAVTSSPAGAQNPPTLSFGSTNPVSITGVNPGTATLTINTTAATSAALVQPKRPGIPWYAAGGATLACLLLFGIPARRRSWRIMLGMLALFIAIAGGVSACGGKGGGGGGGGGGNSGTTSGAYTITVTATSGATTATGTVALTVQ